MSKYVSPEVLKKVKEMDLITYFKTYNPNELVKKSNNVYNLFILVWM